MKKMLSPLPETPRTFANTGFLPNFAADPVREAIGRERSALASQGLPTSSVRVGKSSKLISMDNPAGLGVYNTLHEPAGLEQGISRAKTEGQNPKSYGFASGGTVPNFASFESTMRDSHADAATAKVQMERFRLLTGLGVHVWVQRTQERFVNVSNDWMCLNKLETELLAEPSRTRGHWRFIFFSGR